MKFKMTIRKWLCVLPEETYADPAALGESTETKPLLAVDVCENKGEVLPHLILRNPADDTEGCMQWRLNSQQFINKCGKN